MSTAAGNAISDGRIRFDALVPSRTLRWSLYFAFWTFLGLVNFGSALMFVRRTNSRIGAWEPLTWEMSSVYVIAVLVPMVIWVTHHLPFRKDTWKSALIMHFLLSVPFSLLHVGGMVGIRKLVYSKHQR